MARLDIHSSVSQRCASALLALCLGLPIRAQGADWLHYEHLLRNRDYPAAVAYLQTLTQQQDARACYELAQLYRNGKGIKPNPARARELLAIAADQGHRESQYLLGMFYVKGIGGAKDPDQAAHYLRLSEQQGHPKAASSLALLQGDRQPLTISPQRVLDAARDGNQQILESVQAKGSLATMQDEQGNNLLILALEHGQLDTAEWLLTQGVNINGQNQFGATALHRVGKDKDVARMQWLLNRDANPNLQNRSGKTPLHLAIESAQPALVGALLKAGAKVDITDNEGLSALAQAQVRQNPSIVATLASYGYALATTDALQKRLQAAQQSTAAVSPLQLAVERNDLSLLKSLLPKSTDPWQINAQGQTLITLAAGHTSPDVLAYLLTHSAGQGWTDQNGRNALFAAIAKDRSDNLKLLINAGMNPLQQDKAGQSPLVFGLVQGSVLSDLLLRAVAPENWQADWLALATSNGLFKVSISLIDHGVDVNKPDSQGHTALYYAAIQGNEEVVAGLLQRSDITAIDNNGNTLLHAVSATRHAGVMRQLLKSSRSSSLLNSLNHLGSAPLHIAVGAGQSDQVKLLLEAGAEKDIKDGNGNTPLILAVMAQDEKIIDTLLRANASLNPRNSNKQNALGIARQQGHENIIKQLEQASSNSSYFHYFAE